ncbi:MAG TPA: hypothetical protein VE891_08900 [Allosphingosinicella sp.]|nr:hypothetical protein [Allosphingosinicella sp.]
MELGEALEVRNQLVGFTRSIARGRAVARTMVTEEGVQISGIPQPLTIAIGVAVGEAEGDYGLAIRTTGPWALVEAELLPAALERTSNVDVQVIEPVKPRLLKIGSSIGHPLISAGTLGAFVRDRQSGRVGILSNNHVLAATNQGAQGDEIFHPGPHDGGGPGDGIAILERFVPLAADNEVDAALALLSDIAFDPADIDGRVALSGRRVAATARLDVCKLGRTTGFTQGKVSAIGLIDVGLDYGTLWCTFDGQIEIRSPLMNPFSAGGDSGSLVVTPGGDSVGLLFGGTATQDGRFDLTFVNPIDRVLDLLDVDLVH